MKVSPVSPLLWNVHKGLDNFDSHTNSHLLGVMTHAALHNKDCSIKGSVFQCVTVSFREQLKDEGCGMCGVVLTVGPLV